MLLVNFVKILMLQKTACTDQKDKRAFQQCESCVVFFSFVFFSLSRGLSCCQAQSKYRTVKFIFANLPVGIYHDKIQVIQNHMPFGIYYDNTVTGKSCTFNLDFFLPPPWEGGQFCNWLIVWNGVLQLPDFFRRDIFNGYNIIFVWVKTCLKIKTALFPIFHRNNIAFYGQKKMSFLIFRHK